MIRENKDILLKVLSEQFSYEVLILDTAAKKHGKLYQINSDTVWYDCQETEDVECQSIFNVKPYLRPMSSMTGKEETAWHELTFGQRWITFDNVERCADWLNSHHIDYRGLIEKGLALEAKEGMYKTE